jgi:hypothetical protein
MNAIRNPEEEMNEELFECVRERRRESDCAYSLSLQLLKKSGNEKTIGVTKKWKSPSSEREREWEWE